MWNNDVCLSRAPCFVTCFCCGSKTFIFSSIWSNLILDRVHRYFAFCPIFHSPISASSMWSPRCFWAEKIKSCMDGRNVPQWSIKSLYKFVVKKTKTQAVGWLSYFSLKLFQTFEVLPVGHRKCPEWSDHNDASHVDEQRETPGDPWHQLRQWMFWSVQQTSFRRMKRQIVLYVIRWYVSCSIYSNKFLHHYMTLCCDMMMWCLEIDADLHVCMILSNT